MGHYENDTKRNFDKIENEIGITYPAVFKKLIAKILEKNILLQFPEGDYRILYCFTKDFHAVLEDKQEDAFFLSEQMNKLNIPGEEGVVHLPFARALWGCWTAYLVFRAKNGVLINDVAYFLNYSNKHTRYLPVFKDISTIYGKKKYHGKNVNFNCSPTTFKELSKTIFFPECFERVEPKTDAVTIEKANQDRGNKSIIEFFATIVQFRKEKVEYFNVDVEIEIYSGKYKVYSYQSFEVQIKGLKHFIEQNTNEFILPL